jgi:glycosyltransferase involved in cell wall biosynthesis
MPAMASWRGRRPVPVLITVRELNVGGIERDVSKIAANLDRTRFEPHVATLYEHGFRYDELQSAKIPILHLPMPGILSRKTAESALRMRRYIRRHKIAVVHSYDTSGILCVPVARSAGVPVVISSMLSYRWLLPKRTQYFLRMTDALSDAVLVNCEALRRYMIADEGVNPRRVEVCYNGVDTREFYPAAAPRPAPLSPGSLVIGTVCVLRPEKNLTLLQEAFARICSRYQRLQLLIVGSGSELETLQQNAARLKLTDNSIFIPAVRDVAAWLRVMDIFVLPSYSEAFSNALLEAMACGCCAVGSRIGGTPELLGEDESRGRLFNSGNAEELAAILSQLIENESLRRELSQRAAALASERLNLGIAVQCTAAMYEKWLDIKHIGASRQQSG